MGTTVAVAALVSVDAIPRMVAFSETEFRNQSVAFIAATAEAVTTRGVDSTA